MKKFLLFIFICTVSLSAQNYSPLHMNNSYQYLMDGYGNLEGYSNIYSLSNVLIEQDTVIANNIYYMLDGKLVRYDSISNELHSICNGTDTVLLDFNGSGSFVQPCLFSQGATTSYASGSGGYFGHQQSLKGYTFIDGRESGDQYWGEGIGKVQGSKYITFYGEYYSLYTKLLEAVIYSDSSYTHLTFNHSAAIQSLQNDLDINTLKFYLLVDHPFTNHDRGLSYIDKVYFSGYYKSSNDSIHIDTLIFTYPGVDPRVYKIDVPLDTFYLNNGYTFYYKAIAKDKGLIPKYTSYPDTGYLSKTILSVNDKKELVTNFNLAQNYPNPFNPTTTISYYIPSESKVNITVYNALGSKVKELVSENKSQGNYEVKFDGAGLASGVYFVTLKAASVDGRQSFTSSKKMILMK